ncbi:hypothetical protein AAC387_Pa06g0638 [Persea americana]
MTPDRRTCYTWMTRVSCKTGRGSATFTSALYPLIRLVSLSPPSCLSPTPSLSLGRSLPFGSTKGWVGAEVGAKIGRDREGEEEREMGQQRAEAGMVGGGGLELKVNGQFCPK